MIWRVHGFNSMGQDTVATVYDTFGTEQAVRAFIAAIAATPRLTLIESSEDGTVWRVELDRRESR